VGRLVESGENMFQPLRMGFGLFEMILKCGLEQLLGSGPGHDGESFYKLDLGVVEVAEFLDEEVFKGIEFRHDGFVILRLMTGLTIEGQCLGD
jgi:hypothetical protein